MVSAYQFTLLNFFYDITKAAAPLHSVDIRMLIVTDMIELHYVIGELCITVNTGMILFIPAYKLNYSPIGPSAGQGMQSLS